MAGEPQEPLMPVDMPAGRGTKVKVWVGDKNQLHVSYPGSPNKDVAETINDVLIPVVLSNQFNEKAPNHVPQKTINRTYQLPDASKNKEVLSEIRLALAEYNLMLVKNEMESQAGSVKKLLKIYSDPRINRQKANQEYPSWPSHDEWVKIIRQGLDNSLLDPLRSIAVSEAIMQELEHPKAFTAEPLVKWLKAQMDKERAPNTPMTEADYGLLVKTLVKAGSYKGISVLVAVLKGLERMDITGDSAWFAADQVMLALTGREKDGSRILGIA